MRIERRGFTLGMLSTAAMAGIPSVAAAAGEDTVKIGMVVSLSGPAAGSGQYTADGAKLGLDRINKAGGILGKKAELVFEDDQSTNSGAVLAFSKLSAGSDFVGFLGTIRSTQMQAMAPDILKAGKPVLFGGSEPSLTELGNPWMFRVRPSDKEAGRAAARFGASDLGKKKWAIVHSTDAFGSSGSKLLLSALSDYDAKAVTVLGTANQTVDFTPIVLAVKQSGADIICTYLTFENDVAIFARQLRQLGVSATWISSPVITNNTTRKLGGPALYGTYAIGGYVYDANTETRAFGNDFETLYKIAPDNQAAWAYDAVRLLGTAVNKAGKTDPDAVRQALHAIKGFQCMEGLADVDEKGDCVHSYNIIKNDGGKLVFIKSIPFGKGA